MTEDPICLEADQSVGEAIELMAEHHIIRIPVVRNGKLVGIVSRTDILSAYVKEEFQVFESEILRDKHRGVVHCGLTENRHSAIRNPKSAIEAPRN